MTRIVTALLWSQPVGTAVDIPEFARHRNATTVDATLSKRLSPTIAAFTAAHGDLTVRLRCRDCCKHPRAAFGAPSLFMHCWPRRLESCCLRLQPQPASAHSKRLHGPRGKSYVRDFTHLCFSSKSAVAHVYACRGNGIALALSGTLFDIPRIDCYQTCLTCLMKQSKLALKNHK